MEPLNIGHFLNSTKFFFSVDFVQNVLKFLRGNVLKPQAVSLVRGSMSVVQGVH